MKAYVYTCSRCPGAPCVLISLNEDSIKFPSQCPFSDTGARWVKSSGDIITEVNVRK